MTIFFAVSVFLLLTLFSVMAPGGTKEIRGHAAPITVYTQFEQKRSAASFEAMKAELAAIMAPIGLEFEWRSLDEPHENQVSADLVVVTFKGACEMDEPAAPLGDDTALGWTHMSDGMVLPFSDVQCDRIRRFIGTTMAGVAHGDRDRVFGRAVGRVLAHELYHVFANTTHHGAAGVAKAAYTAAELVADRFHFEDKETRALRSGKEKDLIRAAQPLRKRPALALTGSH